MPESWHILTFQSHNSNDYWVFTSPCKEKVLSNILDMTHSTVYWLFCTILFYMYKFTYQMYVLPICPALLCGITSVSRTEKLCRCWREREWERSRSSWSNSVNSFCVCIESGWNLGPGVMSVQWTVLCYINEVGNYWLTLVCKARAFLNIPKAGFYVFKALCKIWSGKNFFITPSLI